MGSDFPVFVGFFFFTPFALVLEKEIKMGKQRAQMNLVTFNTSILLSKRKKLNKTDDGFITFINSKLVVIIHIIYHQSRMGRFSPIIQYSYNCFIY